MLDLFPLSYPGVAPSSPRTRFPAKSLFWSSEIAGSDLSSLCQAYWYRMGEIGSGSSLCCHLYPPNGSEPLCEPPSFCPESHPPCPCPPRKHLPPEQCNSYHSWALSTLLPGSSLSSNCFWPPLWCLSPCSHHTVPCYTFVTAIAWAAHE